MPGIVGGMNRHMRSLRTLERDHGWIHRLLAEAENERMHLFIFLDLKKPSLFFRMFIATAQGIFFNWFFLAYLISPRYCHRFVGYLEEEATRTYSVLLKHMDEGHLDDWKNMPAPKEAISYYDLPPDANFRDVILSVRADESIHREVNHHFADLKNGEDIENDEVEVKSYVEKPESPHRIENVKV